VHRPRRPSNQTSTNQAPAGALALSPSTLIRLETRIPVRFVRLGRYYYQERSDRKDRGTHDAGEAVKTRLTPAVGAPEVQKRDRF
jgi:hypothetical protein